MNPDAVHRNAEQPAFGDGAIPHQVGGEGALRRIGEQAGMNDLYAGLMKGMAAEARQERAMERSISGK